MILANFALIHFLQPLDALLLLLKSICSFSNYRIRHSIFRLDLRVQYAQCVDQ